MDEPRRDVAEATHHNVREALERARHGVGSHIQASKRMTVEEALTYAHQLQAENPELSHVRIQKSGPWLQFHPDEPD